MTEDKEYRSECCICGEPAPMGIPFSFCKEHREVVEKWETAKRNHRETLMCAKNIVPSVEYSTGIEDVDLMLNTISEHLAEIKFREEFIEHCMHNIQSAVKSHLKDRKADDD